MFEGIGFWELVIILIIVLIIFGPKRLPELAQALAKAVKVFKSELSNSNETKKRKKSRKKEVN